MNPDSETVSPDGTVPGRSCCDPQTLRETAWHALAEEQVYFLLASSPFGLDADEVRERTGKFGSNTLPAKKPVALREVILRQFKSPLIYILMIAALISFSIGEFADGIFILAVITVNACIGTLQEWKAEKSAQALQALLRIMARVRRNRHIITVDASEIVPGDIVLLGEGDRVPADIRILRQSLLNIDESLLSGESLPVEKDAAVLPEHVPFMSRANMAYASSTVISGNAEGIVTATGLVTEVGKIAQSVVSTEAAKPPLVIRMETFSRRIGILVIAACSVLAVIAIAKGMPSIEVFFIAVALAVSAIPEGLPVAITVALSIGVSRMAARNVIVRKLTAVEALGSCTCIASDKTGTLTVNAQTLQRVELPDGNSYVVTGEGYHGEGAVTNPEGVSASETDRQHLSGLAVLGIICNGAELVRSGEDWSHHGDPIDIAFLAFGYKLGIHPDGVRSGVSVIREIPFDAGRRYAATFYTDNNRFFVAVKGAMEVVIPMCSVPAAVDGDLTPALSDLMERAVQLSGRGYRVLAVAGSDLPPPAGGREPEQEDIPLLTFLGFACFIDPVRPDAKESISACRKAGIRVVMVTGDHPATALAIARNLDIAASSEEVITGAGLEALGSADDPGTLKKIEKISVFARVIPLQKLAIVKSLQSLGHYVAVTGDGVNDTPALKHANIGVAMGSGTDLAKDTAPIIVTDDAFSSIVAGIHEGRIIYDNIRKVTYLLISTGFAEVVLFTLSLLSGLPLPLLAVQLLWLNLVTNGIQDVALAFESGEPGVMKKRPRPPTETIINRQMAEETVVSGLYMGLSAFMVWHFLIGSGLEESPARNLVLLLMVLLENCHVFNCRSERISAFRIPISRNYFLILGVAAAQGIHILAMYIPFLQDVLGVQPVTVEEWLIFLGIALVLIAVMESYKFLGKFRNSDTGGDALAGT